MTEKVKYEYESHKFVHSKSLGKMYCVKCGLVNANNPFSRWAVEKGCYNEEHPTFQSTKTKFTNKFKY